MKRWTMRLAMLLAFVTGAACAQDLTGNWQGTLQSGGNGLRIVMKVTKDDGKYKAVLYSVDQGGAPLPTTTFAQEGKTVEFAIKTLNLTYAGSLAPDGSSIAGKATQNEQTHELNLQRVNEEDMWAIPKPPKPMPADAKPKFEVATIKPGQPNQPGKNIGFRGREFLARNFNVNDLIALSYGLHAKQIVGAPEWFNSQLFDISGVPDVEGQPSMPQMGMLMENLLAERFGMKFHYEKRELSVFALTVAKGGPKMTVTESSADAGSGFRFRLLGALTVSNMTMKEFAKWMQGSVTDRPIVDQTGLKDRYDFTLKWTPDDSQFAAFRSTGAIPQVNPEDPNAAPSLYTAVQEQLGLKLDPVKAQDEVMVIDHVEKPSEN
jgi:uncharacterized protein (TIGR03435 family)